VTTLLNSGDEQGIVTKMAAPIALVFNDMASKVRDWRLLRRTLKSGGGNPARAQLSTVLDKSAVL
jgi:hypothetical protein